MTDFPDSVYEPRTKENKIGTVYDANRTRTAYAEDITKLDDEVVAIENTLGLNPEGESDTVNERIAILETPSPLTMEIKVLDDNTVLTTGDGKIIVCIPTRLDGWKLESAHAFISTASSSGLPTVQIRNVTLSVDMLSTKISIDETEKNSYEATTQPVINEENAQVSVGDQIAIDIDIAGTGAKGLGVILNFVYT